MERYFARFYGILKESCCNITGVRNLWEGSENGTVVVNLRLVVKSTVVLNEIMHPLFQFTQHHSVCAKNVLSTANPSYFGVKMYYSRNNLLI